MQAIPEIKTPRMHPPIALLKDAPKNKPTTANKSIIITETTVLNFFIESYPFVKFKFVRTIITGPFQKRNTGKALTGKLFPCFVSWSISQAASLKKIAEIWNIIWQNFYIRRIVCLCLRHFFRAPPVISQPVYSSDAYNQWQSCRLSIFSFLEL